MKKQAWHLTAFLGTLLLVTAAVGQNNPASLRVDIPFSFVVGDRTLPAGRYFVSNHGEKTLHIVDAHNRGTFVLAFMVDGNSPESSGKLVFYRYGDNYFLAQVWGTSGRQGKQLFKSSAEKEWAHRGTDKEIAVLRAAN